MRSICAIAIVVMTCSFAVDSALGQADPAGEEGGGAAPVPESSSGWEFELAPYVFLAGVSGSVTTSLFTYPVNVSLSELLENLRMGFFVSFMGQERRWGFMVDFQYISLEGQGPDWLPLTLRLDNLIFEGDATYAPSDDSSLRFLAGLRTYNVSQKLSFPSDTLNIEGSTTLVDPVAGVRWSSDLGRKWTFNTRVDIGGFGISSEFTYQMELGITWRFAERWGLPVGYRMLGYDIQTDDITFDIRLSGLQLGVRFVF